MIELSLTPDEVVAIVRGMDAWPIAETPPDGWFALQEKIKQAIEAKPDIAAVINEKLDGR